MITASMTGVFKMILMVIGGLVLLRFIGQLLIAKRNLQEEKSLINEQRKAEELKRKTAQNYGKTTLFSSTKNKQQVPNSSIEDVEYEELNN